MGNIYFNIVCLYLLEWACSVHPLGDVFSFPDLPGGRLDRPGFQLTGHGHDPLHDILRSLDDHLVNQYNSFIGGQSGSQHPDNTISSPGFSQCISLQTSWRDAGGTPIKASDHCVLCLIVCYMIDVQLNDCCMLL